MFIIKLTQIVNKYIESDESIILDECLSLDTKKCSQLASILFRIRLIISSRIHNSGGFILALLNVRF